MKRASVLTQEKLIDVCTYIQIDKDVISPAVSAIDKEVFKLVFKTEILKHALTPVREISGTVCFIKPYRDPVHKCTGSW